jgi:hypothetical protein
MNINWTIILNWTAVITAVVAVVGAILAFVGLILQSRSTKHTTAISVLLQLEARFDEASMHHDRKKASYSLLSNTNLGVNKNSDAIDNVLNFFELIGLLLRKDALDQEMITSEFSTYAYCYWIASKDYISRSRNRDPNYWINYEKLIEAMKRTN